MAHDGLEVLLGQAGLAGQAGKHVRQQIVDRACTLHHVHWSGCAEVREGGGGDTVRGLTFRSGRGGTGGHSVNRGGEGMHEHRGDFGWGKGGHTVRRVRVEGGMGEGVCGGGGGGGGFDI